MFQFSGTLPASKSLLNRALILQSYFPQIEISGDSQSSDVRILRQALKDLGHKKEFYLGEGGTSFRFFALRLSRERGEFRLQLSKRLSERPFRELVEVLKQFSVHAEMRGTHFIIQSEGWRWNESNRIHVDSSQSSQFASALLLNAWSLPQALVLETQDQMGSESYFLMTQKLIQSLGLQMDVRKKHGRCEIHVPPHQSPKNFRLKAEMDLSSAFTLACAAALNGQITLLEFPVGSLQPDIFGLDLLLQMGTPLELGPELHVKKASRLRALQANLGDSPDLFPCLAVMCAFAEGTSELRGAEQLAYKESNRIAKTSELLQLAGVKHKVFKDGVSIEGQPQLAMKPGAVFDPDHDHRMAFAAALFRLRGQSIEIRDLKVVEKSFPEFWKILKLPHMNGLE